ncbi:hypothetical protein ACP275_02G136500 [Erythranthe tilingii]
MVVVMDDMIDVSFTDFDVDAVGVGSFLNGLVVAAARGSTIEERIQLLDGVAARHRRISCRRVRRHPIHISHYSSLGIFPAEAVSDEEEKCSKTESSHLVAAALEMDTTVEKNDGRCNICFRMATEPVLTCCGHLFCRSCLYRFSDVHLTFEKCPVCQKGVSFSTPLVSSFDSRSTENRGRLAETSCDRTEGQQNAEAFVVVSENDDYYTEWLVDQELQALINDDFSINDALFNDSDQDLNTAGPPFSLARKGAWTEDTRETRRRRLN